MLTFLRAAAFAAAIFVGLPFAAAQDYMAPPNFDMSKGIKFGVGKTIGVTGSSTGSFNFGFQSQFVRICVEDGSQRVYLRLWSGAGTVTDTATSESNFINGVPGTAHSGSALPIKGVDSGDAHPFCESYPFQVTGVLVGFAEGIATNEGTVDIWAFPKQ